MFSFSHKTHIFSGKIYANSSIFLIDFRSKKYKYKHSSAKVATKIRLLNGVCKITFLRFIVVKVANKLRQDVNQIEIPIANFSIFLAP